MNQRSLDELARKKCVPCEGGVPLLPREKALQYLEGLEGWRLGDNGKSIRRELLMKDFVAAVDLIVRVKDAAEALDHHPDLHLTGYRRLVIELSTHAIGGLSENDFILAARIEKLPKALKA